HLNIERSFIYKPETEWLYAHHPYICFFKEQYIAIWSNGIKDEDASGQRVAMSVSKDFTNWSKPQVLAVPNIDQESILNVLTAAGFHQYGDTLVVYYGEYSPKRTHTKLWAKYTIDGKHWSSPIDLNLPVNANQGPIKLANGRLLICGNFTFCYTDDPKGLSGWQLTSIYPRFLYKEDNPATFYSPAEKQGFPPLCEASVFQTKNGVLHALFRVTGKGWQGKLWQAESLDNAITWTRPIETNFTDNDSKFHLGQLPNGNFYYVGIPDTLQHYNRNPLILSVSKNGLTFNQHYVIANSLYQLKKEGLWKGGQYGYPNTFIHEGWMYVIISRQKEAIEVIRFKLNQIN
ncbi:MAG: hypothetical protein RLY16_1973, partial [Bacteroidota bacterium]